MSVQGDLFAGDWLARLEPPRSRPTSASAPGIVLPRPTLARALAILILGYFLVAAVLGPNGLARWSAIHALRTERAVLLARLEAERGRLRNHVRLLDPARADVDLVDELVRRDLGFARPDEIVLSH